MASKIVRNADYLEGVSLRTLLALCLCAGNNQSFKTKRPAVEYLKGRKPKDEQIRAKFAGTSKTNQKYRDSLIFVARELRAKGADDDALIESIITRYHWYRNEYNL